MEEQRGRIGDSATIIDHLVDAVGEPSVSLSRVQTLVDIDHHPDTTQAEIIGRLELDKSSAARNVDWLVNYGCVTKHFSPMDAREVRLKVTPYSKKHLDLALGYFNNSHEYLQNFLLAFIKGFTNHKPTLRDAKVLLTVGQDGAATKNEVLRNLYNGPASTDNRAIQALIEEGLIEKNGS